MAEQSTDLKQFLIQIDEDGFECDRWEVTRKALVVGRGEKADVLILDKRASRQHCAVVRQKEGDCTIEDLFSKNGTWVNNEQITKAVLKPYDQIRVGNTLLTFKISRSVDLMKAVTRLKEDAAKAAKAAKASKPGFNPPKTPRPLSERRDGYGGR